MRSLFSGPQRPVSWLRMLAVVTTLAGCGSVGGLKTDAGGTGGTGAGGMVGGAGGSGGGPTPGDGGGSGGAPGDGGVDQAPPDGGGGPARWDIDNWDNALWT